MGIYLAQPCTVVEIDVGGSDDLDFAVGSMQVSRNEIFRGHYRLFFLCQGWRMNMEDAHIAFPSVSIDLRTPRKIALFGVFDGHGGITHTLSYIWWRVNDVIPRQRSRKICPTSLS